MVTKEQAQSLRTFHYNGPHGKSAGVGCKRSIGPRGGVTEQVTEVRASGQCQTWKTRPAEFRLPVKYGMYESTAITHDNASDWHVPEDCPLRKTSGPVPA